MRLLFFVFFFFFPYIDLVLDNGGAVQFISSIDALKAGLSQHFFPLLDDYEMSFAIGFRIAKKDRVFGKPCPSREKGP